MKARKKGRPSERTLQELWLQESFLCAYGIKKPVGCKDIPIWGHTPDPGTDQLYDATIALRQAIDSAMGKRGPYTQAWMRSAIFLRMAAMLGGNEGFETMRDAIWAYTAALIEGIGKLCDNPAILESIPDNRKFDSIMRLIAELRKAVEDQMRLLRDVGKAKIEYEKSETRLAFGRILLKGVHATDCNCTSLPFRALCDAIGRYGPEGIPNTDWDAAVMVAHAILFYEARKAQESTNNGENAPKTANNANNANVPSNNEGR